MPLGSNTPRPPTANQARLRCCRTPASRARPTLDVAGPARSSRPGRREEQREDLGLNLCVVPDEQVAAVNPRYGSPDILEIRQVPKPEPNAREILHHRPAKQNRVIDPDEGDGNQQR